MMTPENRAVMSALRALKEVMEKRCDKEHASTFELPAGTQQRAQRTGIAIGYHRSAEIVNEAMFALETADLKPKPKKQ